MRIEAEGTNGMESAKGKLGDKRESIGRGRGRNRVLVSTRKAGGRGSRRHASWERSSE
jgi:hypothetical protein